MADNNPVKGGYTYTFVGTHAPEAKASIGDKNEQNKWPILWEVGDKLGVYDADGTLVGAAELAAESAGQNQGTFTVTANREFTEGEALTLKYPYSEGEAFVPTQQTQLAVSSSAGLGANAVASATTTFAAAGTSFSLSHANAYVRFELASEEFKDYTLNGVTLWCKGEKLSGDGDGQDYVKATLGEPVVLGQEAKYIWMTANRVNLSDKDFYAIIHMTKGIETVTLPVSLTGKGELKAHAVTSIKLPKLVKSLAPAWYEPVETRYIAAYGDGWCYGEENTVLFETTSNVTKSVDLKARGNFRKVSEPKYVQLKYSCDRETGSYIAIDGNAAYANSTFLEFEVGTDYAINVMPRKKHNNYGWLAGMVIKDAGKNVIWGMNLWASYSTITPVAYDNGSVLPYNIGTGPVAQTSLDTWYMNGVYFQWGRPFAFPWSTSVSSDKAQIEDVKPDLETSASNPYVMYCYSNADYNDWHYNKNSADFWGNPSADGAGGKSIFDQCPKGYRVISPAIVNEISEKISTDGEGKIVVSDGVTYSTSTTISHFAYKEVQWPLAGGFFNNDGDKLARSDNKKELAAYWTNSVSGNNGYVWFHQNNSTTDVLKPKYMKNNSGKATAFPVRCMVDTENR